MKQTYLKSLFLSLLMIVVGNIGALAGEEVISFSADTDKGSVTSNGQTSSGDQITKSGVTIFSSNGCLGSGSYRVYTNGNLSISTTEGNITKVEITCNGTTDGNKDYNPNKFTLNSGSTGSYSGSGYIGTWTGEAASVVLDASAQVRMTKIEVTVNTGESNKILKGIMLSGEYPTTFFVGDEFSFGETGTVTAVYDDNSTKVVTDKAMFSGYDMSTVSNQTVTVSYTEGEVTVTTTYDITVKEAPAFHYEKVTTAPSDWNGEYLIVYEGGSLAFDGGLSTLDAIGNTISVTIKDNKIASSEAVDAATFTIAKNDAGTYTIKSASGKYIGVSSNSNGLKQTDNASTYTHNLSIDDDENAVIEAAFSGSKMSLRYNTASNQTRFRYYSNGQQPIQLYKKVATTTNQYTLVAGEEETPFEGLTLTKELPAQVKFYIKDSNGNEYHSTEAQSELIIIAENHENLPTSADGKDFYLMKANTWNFAITEPTDEGATIKLTVTPQTEGETKYMLTSDYLVESEKFFDANFQATKEFTAGEAFFITRSDDYGLANLTAAESNVYEGGVETRVWEFKEGNYTVGFVPGKTLNAFCMKNAGTYTITLNFTNNTVTVEPVANQYTLVTVGDTETEYLFNGLTLTQALPASTKFYIKDGNGNKYYGTNDGTGVATITAENHENLPTSAEGKEFYFMKANTWVFTITEPTDEGATIKLTVNPQTEGETKYMITNDNETETEYVFDKNLQLTKEMDTTPFYIIRSDDYGISELTAKDRNHPDGYARFVFSEENNSAEFILGERRNMYEMSEAGNYTFTLDLENSKVTVEQAPYVGNLNNTDTGVFAGEEAFSGKNKQITGKIVTAKDDVTVYYESFGNKGYLNDSHIRMYDNGTILKFTAPDGYLLTNVTLTKSSGNFADLTTDTKTYSDSDGAWEGEAKSVTFTSSNTIRLTTAEVTLKKDNYVYLTISDAEWATFVTPSAVMFPDDVTAYIITEVENGNAKSEQIVVAPAGTPVIVNGDAGVHKLVKAEDDVNLDFTNMLKSSDGTVTGDGTIYVLAVQDGQPGFTRLANGKKLSEGKAYLQVDNASGAKINLIIDGESTGIRDIENAVDFSDGDWYNLQGVKITNPQRGIYIHNGKKVVIK